MNSRPLFTIGPGPEPVWYVPLARATLCLSCEAVFLPRVRCPNCGDEHIMALATWLASAKAAQA